MKIYLYVGFAGIYRSLQSHVLTLFLQYEEKICIVEARESQLLAETAVVSEQQDQIEQNEMENSSLR